MCRSRLVERTTKDSISHSKARLYLENSPTSSQGAQKGISYHGLYQHLFATSGS